MKAKAGRQVPARGVKKAPGKTEAKASAGDFLKQRLGKKVRELRASAAEHMGDGEAPESAAAPRDLSSMLAEAARRGGDFERDNPQGAEVEEDTPVIDNGREAENTRKRFYTECRRVISAADVVIEVLDARDPASSRSAELEKDVLAAGKKLVLLINKIDLVPREAVEAWMQYLKRSFPTVAFKSAHGECKRPIHATCSTSRASEGLLRSTHAVVGADDLMQLLKNYARTGDGSKMKAHINVGIVGYPNTGKSSVINSIKRTNAVEAGGRAGVTKEMQEVKIDSKVTLIDSPGVVFEGDSADPTVALRNILAVDRLPDPVGVVEALIAKAPRQSLLEYYGLEQDFGTVGEFLVHVARTRGKLKRGSGLDLPSAAKAVVTDWTSGRFRYYVLPPKEFVAAAGAAERETAEVVHRLAPALDINALLNGKGDAPMVIGGPGVLRQAGDGDVDMAETDM
ncbi:unnamed protein product [Prorocentrum cordatum]|uniref:CP-type G domain-containing protein n=1 Tax=Prorocentrum cordatum TaxID=2364126 RepID=A0ABN9UH88_9DINO|nr:unnamed protein product [Polarella glacialis]|mmetsp:Transcript_56512/g.146903  ORF Transcript_56512/g.146903 Transcript_56512/m.146903 type:complete len:455 (-) Transcript_56512:216-1580(-)